MWYLQPTKRQRSKRVDQLRKGDFIISSWGERLEIWTIYESDPGHFVLSTMYGWSSLSGSDLLRVGNRQKQIN